MILNRFQWFLTNFTKHYLRKSIENVISLPIRQKILNATLIESIKDFDLKCILTVASCFSADTVNGEKCF